ncbi:MAG: hypothetical protein HFJ26_01560 [Clostridia bacterium]|nr:hypothetical protein [Clostridia bacterium]
MNKQECKKYMRKAYKRVINSNKTLSEENIEIEMKNVLNEEIMEYITYSKIAVHNMIKSGNLKITLKDILAQIDILPTIYSKYNIVDLENKT